MLLRIFEFQVGKKRERRMAAFMRREALRLLKRIPACRAAYMLRDPKKRGSYIWITVWTNDAARARAMARKDWQRVVTQEMRLFLRRKPRIRHYQVVLEK